MISGDSVVSFVRRYLLWQVLAPLAACFLLDYAVIVAEMLKIAIVIGLVSWWSLGFIGVWAAVMTAANAESKWQRILDYRFANIVSPIRWGFETVQWLLEEEKQDKRDVVEELGEANG